MAPTPATEEGQPPEIQSVETQNSSFWKDIQTVPNLLSLSRIVMILISAAFYLNGHHATGLIVGAIAGATDWLDGWLARLLNQTTELGAILDRVSDLVIETVAFACILHYRLLPPSFFIVYLVREYLVTSARLFVAEKGRSIPSSIVGKVKSNLVMGSFVGLFAGHAQLFGGESTSEIIYKIGYGMMIGGLVCSYISGAQYMRSFGQIYSETKQ